MDLPWVISIYFVTWWIVLFAILPLGIQSHAEAGTKPEPGHDPGAPVNPNLKKKAFTTSWVAAIVTALIWATYTFHWIRF
jgi:predicted secreted protein